MNPLKRAQVKALLDVMGSDDFRLALTDLWLDKVGENTYFVATDSYKMIRFKMHHTQDIVEGENLAVPREELVKWYKLANAKDELTEEDLISMLVKTDRKHPLTEALLTMVPEPTESISFQAKFMQLLETVNGYPLTLKMTGKLGPMYHVDTQGSHYIIMPLKA